MEGHIYMNTEQKELFNMLKEAVENIYTNFPQIIKIKGLEQCAVAIIYAYLFQKIQSSKYKSLDLNSEYNKNGDFVKATCNFPKGIRPDIILHKMHCNDNNKMVVEFKGWWNLKNNKDIQKLKDLTDQTGEYKYLLGIWALLGKDGPSYTIVIDGQELIIGG